MFYWLRHAEVNTTQAGTETASLPSASVSTFLSPESEKYFFRMQENKIWGVGWGNLRHGGFHTVQACFELEVQLIS